MPTKRRTEHDQPRPSRKPDNPAIKTAPGDEPSTRARTEDSPEAARERPANRSGQRKESRSEQPASGRPTATTGAEPGADDVPADPKPAGDREAAADRRIEELTAQLEEANTRHLRLAADFDNYKKRARQEQMDTMRFAAATVVERLLPVLDDVERALAHAPADVDESWLKGVRLTFQKLQDVLASVGVERIEAVGSTFDPKLHEAVGSEESAEHPEDTVVVELRPGYRMHERVLRPALVKVARPPA